MKARSRRRRGANRKLAFYRPSKNVHRNSPSKLSHETWWIIPCSFWLIFARRNHFFIARHRKWRATTFAKNVRCWCSTSKRNALVDFQQFAWLWKVLKALKIAAVRAQCENTVIKAKARGWVECWGARYLSWLATSLQAYILLKTFLNLLSFNYALSWCHHQQSTAYSRLHKVYVQRSFVEAQLGWSLLQ